MSICPIDPSHGRMKEKRNHDYHYVELLCLTCSHINLKRKRPIPSEEELARMIKEAEEYQPVYKTLSERGK